MILSDSYADMVSKSIVDHVLSSCAELLVALYHLIDSLYQVLLGYSLATVTDSEHTSLGTH